MVIGLLSARGSNIRLASFLVSKGNSEREAHSKILECLVLVAQLENVVDKFSPIPVPSGREEKTLKIQQNTRRSSLFDTKDKQQVEVEKVTRRLPKWFRNQIYTTYKSDC